MHSTLLAQKGTTKWILQRAITPIAPVQFLIFHSYDSHALNNLLSAHSQLEEATPLPQTPKTSKASDVSVFIPLDRNACEPIGTSNELDLTGYRWIFCYLCVRENLRLHHKHVDMNAFRALRRSRSMMPRTARKIPRGCRSWRPIKQVGHSQNNKITHVDQVFNHRIITWVYFEIPLYSAHDIYIHQRDIQKKCDIYSSIKSLTIVMHTAITYLLTTNYRRRASIPKPRTLPNASSVVYLVNYSGFRMFWAEWVRYRPRPNVFD